MCKKETHFYLWSQISNLAVLAAAKVSISITDCVTFFFPHHTNIELQWRVSLVEKYFTVASYQVEELSEPSVLLAFQLQGLFFVSRNFEKFGTVNSRTEILVNFNSDGPWQWVIKRGYLFLTAKVVYLSLVYAKL